MGHPQAKQMMADVRAGRITGLIFSKLARLARNTKELLELSEFFRQQGADLISLAESIDTSSPAGRFFYTILAAMAQWEREEIADRVKASVVVRAKLEKSLGGAAPFGYQWKDGVLVLEEKEASIRREIFELFATHKRLKRVARLLNESGYRTRKGSEFSDTTVKRLIRDPVAKGQRRVNSTRSLGEAKNWERKPEVEWEWVDVPACVSAELWEACNAILDSRKHTKKKPARQVVHLFTGFAWCSCDGRMYMPSKSKKYTCQRCRNKIPTDTLELIFKTKLQEFFESPDDILKAIALHDESLRSKEGLLAASKEEIKGLKQRMDRVYVLYMDEQISPEGFGERYRPP